MRFLAPTFLICCVLFPAVSSAAPPTDLSDMDSWWLRRVQDRTIPSVAELAQNGADKAPTIRAVDLLLQRYLGRQQMYLLHEVASELRERWPGTLLAIWGHAWHVWVATKYPRQGATEADLRSAVLDLSEEQLQTLCSLSSACPDELTGALAVRLLALHGGEGCFETGGTYAELAEQISGEHPETVCASMIAIHRGVVAEARGDFEAAARFWLQGLGRYPFESELPQWRDKLVEALLRTRDEAQASLLAEKAPTRKDLIELTHELLRIREARELASAGDPERALQLLSTTRERAEGRMTTSVLWREVVQEIDAEMARLRSLAGLANSIDGFLERLRKVSASGFPPLLAEGMEEFGENVFFCNAALSVTRERVEKGEMRRKHAARECWEALARTEKCDAAVRCQAYRLLVEWQRHHLNLLRLTRESGALVMETIARAVHQRGIAEEDALLEALEQAEELLRRSGVSAEAVDLADALYASYRSLGIINLPKDLYLSLAEMASEPLCEDLARRAERMGEMEESIAILRILAEKQGQDPVASRPPTETLQELIRVLVMKKDLSEAANVAREIAEQSAGTPQETDAWYRAADLYYQAKDYTSSREVLARLSGEDLNSFMETEVKKLYAMSLYHTGVYDRSLQLIDELTRQDNLDAETEMRLTKARAYTHLYRQEYSRALSEFEGALQEYEFSGKEKREIQDVVDKLGRFLK